MSVLLSRFQCKGSPGDKHFCTVQICLGSGCIAIKVCDGVSDRRIRKFLGLPDPLVKGMDPSIVKQK
jgi:hypothetical protein